MKIRQLTQGRKSLDDFAAAFFSPPEVLTSAVKGAKTNPGPIILAVSREDEMETYQIDYHGGEKYAALVRNHQPDILTTDILKPR